MAGTDHRRQAVTAGPAIILVEPQLAGLDQRQRRGHRDRLAHRIDAENIVRLHGARLATATLWIAAAERMLVADLAVPQDQQHGPGDHVVGDVVVDARGDGVEMGRVEADAGRVGPRPDAQ